MNSDLAHAVERRAQAGDTEKIRQFGVNSDLASTAERRAQAGDTEKIRQFGVNSDLANTVESRLAKAAEDTSSTSAALLEAIRLKNAEDTPRGKFTGGFGDRIMGEESEIMKAVEQLESLTGKPASIAEVKAISKEIRTAKTAQDLVRVKSETDKIHTALNEIDNMNVSERQKQALRIALVTGNKRLIPIAPSEFDVKPVK